MFLRAVSDPVDDASNVLFNVGVEGRRVRFELLELPRGVPGPTNGTTDECFDDPIDDFDVDDKDEDDDGCFDDDPLKIVTIRDFFGFG